MSATKDDTNGNIGAGEPASRKQRTKAICVFRDGSRILVGEAFDPVKKERFLRPLGGRVEFGERSDEAVTREIGEEIGAKIDSLRLLGVLENIFTYSGVRGHEIVFVYDGRFLDRTRYATPRWTGQESDGALFPVFWLDLDRLADEPRPLYPDGLHALLRRETARESRPATLYILSGLPGSGKSALSAALARRTGSAWLRIDTMEQALRDLCGIEVEGEGYRLAYRIAADILRTGNGAIADSCNPIELTRREWEETATAAGARFVNIEVICSDKEEHRRRVEQREPPSPGFCLPTWKEVLHREFHPWHGERILVDSAHIDPDACARIVLDSVASLENRPQGS